MPKFTQWTKEVLEPNERTFGMQRTNIIKGAGGEFVCNVNKDEYAALIADAPTMYDLLDRVSRLNMPISNDELELFGEIDELLKRHE